MNRLWLAAPALMLLLTGMGGQPWQTGRLISVGNVPFSRLAIEQSDGRIVAIRPAPAGHGVDAVRLRQLGAQAGQAVRYRPAREVATPLGPELELNALELAEASH
jgi:hypothetical protein